jgi:branched-chain amino acid transport system substrate-binding protein
MDGLDRRGILRLLAGVGAAGATSSLAACVSNQVNDPRDPVRIGLLAPATGANKAIGGDLENGFKLYLETRSEQLAGHPVQLVIEDEGETVAQGTEALKKLHGQSVVAVVGVANPDLLLAARGDIEKSQIPLLAAHGSSSEMASAVYIWRTAYLNNEPGRAVAQYLKTKGKVALVGLKDTFGQDVAAGFTNDSNDTVGPIWVPATANPDKAHLADAVAKVLASPASYIFTWLPTNYLIPFIQQLPGGKYAVYAPGTVSEGAAGDQLNGIHTVMKSWQSPNNGLYTVMQYSSDLNNAANRAFSSLFQTRFQRSPTAYAVSAYDAASVLDSALTLIGDDGVSSQRLNLEIANVGQIVSPRGNWQFTQARAPQQKWYLRQIRMDGPVLSNVLVSELSTLA